LEFLQRPERLWSRAEVLTRPTPVPPVSGVYGWHFANAPDSALGSNRLLYVGIAPRHMRPRVSRQSLRTRIRYHFRGNAAGSTLRLTLGCLLGLELRRVGSGARQDAPAQRHHHAGDPPRVVPGSAYLPIRRPRRPPARRRVHHHAAVEPARRRSASPAPTAATLRSATASTTAWVRRWPG
jgi:hypothetical protein